MSHPTGFSKFCSRFGAAIKGVFATAALAVLASISAVVILASCSKATPFMTSVLKITAGRVADNFAHAFWKHKPKVYGLGLSEKALNEFKEKFPRFARAEGYSRVRF